MTSGQVDFGIAPESAKALRTIFDRVPGVERVWIYGSRARGDHRPESDIDLVVDASGFDESRYLAVLGAIEALELVYRVDVNWWQRDLEAGFRARIERDRKVFWEPRRAAVDAGGAGAVALKEFQLDVLDRFGTYLDALVAQRAKADKTVSALRAAEVDPTPEMLDFPRQAWQALADAGGLPPAYAARPYSSRFDGAGRAVPNVCFKVPTGGGKTLLAAAAVARLLTTYQRRHTGLVLWVVPTEAIYRQTLKSLSNRDHPYRQMLAVAGAGRVKVLEKDSPLTRLDVESNLCVMLLMLQSAARQSKETLRFFRDRGSVHGFFPREDDLDAHWALLGELPNLDVYAPAGISAEAARRTKGSIIKDSLGNVMRLVRPIVVVDEGHRAYNENALSTIDGFNPAFVLELTATPRTDDRGRKGANVLVDVRGRDLEAAEMIKLPINVDVRPWHDWQSCLDTAVAQLDALQAEATRLDADSGRYIRPILLVQVERTGREQRDQGFIHAEDARERLLQLGFHPKQIAIKTSERDELKQPENIDLLSPACEVRAIITKQALQEGWDCPFAYVLCALAAGRNRSAMTQLVGRILRQPHVTRTGRAALDECHVFCHDARTADVVRGIKDALEAEGMGDLAVAVRGDTGDAGGDKPRQIRRREGLEKLRIFLPRVTWVDGDAAAPVRRELDYESDVLGGIDWTCLTIDALACDWRPDSEPAREQRFRLGLEVLDGAGPAGAEESVRAPARLDRARVVRALVDLVPNPWVLWPLVDGVLARLRAAGVPEARIAASSASLIERLRLDLESARDRLAEAVFLDHVRDGRIEFALRADATDYSVPDGFDVALPDRARPLVRDDGHVVERSLFAPFFERMVDNGFETEFACYLDSQAALRWWHRNVARTQYGLQGWQRHKVYPDFVFATAERDGQEMVVVMETKGAHLQNDDTTYKRALLERLRGMFRDERLTPAGSLALESPGGARLTCDLVFDEAWRGELATRYFG